MKKNIVAIGLAFVFCLSSCLYGGAKSESVNMFVRSLRKNNVDDARVETIQYSEDETERAEQMQRDGVSESDFLTVGDPNSNASYFITYEKQTATGGLDLISNYGQYEDMLYPGCVVDISNPVPAKYPLKQSPVTLSLSNMTTSKNYRPYIVNEPSFSNAAAGINKMLDNAHPDAQNFPTRLYMTSSYVSNSSEMNIALGLNVSYNGLNVKNDFDYSTSSSATKLVIKLSQVYYKVICDSKTTASEYFADGQSDSQIIDALKDTVPAYVSSVSYGRVAIITISSHESITSLKDNLDVQYADAAGVTANISSVIKNNNLQAEVFVYGGRIGNGSALGTTADLNTVLSEFSKEYCPDVPAALPISYSLSYITDGSPAKTIVASDTVYQKVYRNRYNWLDVHMEGIEIFSRSEGMSASSLKQMFQGVKLQLENLHCSIKHVSYNDQGQRVFEWPNSSCSSQQRSLAELNGGTVLNNDNYFPLENTDSMRVQIDNYYITNRDFEALELTVSFKVSKVEGLTEKIRTWLRDLVNAYFENRTYSATAVKYGLDDFTSAEGFYIDFVNNNGAGLTAKFTCKLVGGTNGN